MSLLSLEDAKRGYMTLADYFQPTIPFFLDACVRNNLIPQGSKVVLSTTVRFNRNSRVMRMNVMQNVNKASCDPDFINVRTFKMRVNVHARRELQTGELIIQVVGTAALVVRKLQDGVGEPCPRLNASDESEGDDFLAEEAGGGTRIPSASPHRTRSGPYAPAAPATPAAAAVATRVPVIAAPATPAAAAIVTPVSDVAPAIPQQEQLAAMLEQIKGLAAIVRTLTPSNVQAAQVNGVVMPSARAVAAAAAAGDSDNSSAERAGKAFSVSSSSNSDDNDSNDGAASEDSEGGAVGAVGTRGATNKYSALSTCSSGSSPDSGDSDASVTEIKSKEEKDNTKLVRKRAASAAAASSSGSESDSAGGAADKSSPHSKRAKGDGKAKPARKRAPAANGKRKAVVFSSDSDSEGGAINRIMQAAEVLPQLKKDFGKKFKKRPSLYEAIASMIDLDRSNDAKLKRRKPSKSSAKTERRKLEAMAVNAVEVYRVEASSGSAARAAFGQNLIQIARQYEVLLQQDYNDLQYEAENPEN